MFFKKKNNVTDVDPIQAAADRLRAAVEEFNKAKKDCYDKGLSFLIYDYYPPSTTKRYLGRSSRLGISDIYISHATKY